VRKRCEQCERLYQTHGLRLCLRRRRSSRHRLPSSRRNRRSKPNRKPSCSLLNKSLQVSVYYLGTLIGCLVGGWVGDKIGRVRTIAFGAAWAILGAALQCSAQNHVWMICARLINGWGTGVLVSVLSLRSAWVERMLTIIVQSRTPSSLYGRPRRPSTPPEVRD
jgi:hypothetical protein